MRNPSNLLALTAVALAFTSLGTARAGEVQLPGTFEIKRQKRPGNAVVVTIKTVCIVSPTESGEPQARWEMRNTE